MAKKHWHGLTVIAILIAGYIVVDTLKFVLSQPVPIAQEQPAVLGEGTVRQSSYQAVHLTNGQVLFGSLREENGPWPVLTNVWHYVKDGEGWRLAQLAEEIKLNRGQILYLEPINPADYGF